MMTFVFRWLRGVIAGWILALVFAMLKRVLERAFRGATPPINDHIKRPRPSAPHNDNVIDTIWIGMSAAQLQTAFGHPHRQESKPDGTYLWSYPDMEVTLERNAVKGWTRKV